MKENTVILELTAQECDAIVASLLELPAKFSMDLITKVREQAIPQIEAAKAEKLLKPQK